jgi:phage anti-repressor protein
VARKRKRSHACELLEQLEQEPKYKRWKELTERERLECLKRYIAFARSRTRVRARWLLISHLQWNKWWALFDAPPIPKRSFPAFYAWLLDTCRKAGLREDEDYRLIHRQRHRQQRVKGLLINNQALDALLSLSL